MMGAFLSWLALTLAGIGFLQCASYAASTRMFFTDLPRDFSALVPLWPSWTDLVLFIGLIVAASRNLKRPWIPTLVAEWAFYAVFIHATGLLFIWLARIAPQGTTADIAAAVMKLPWQDQRKFRSIFQLIGTGRVMRDTAIPQLLMALLYALRIRNVVMSKSRAKVDETERT